MKCTEAMNICVFRCRGDDTIRSVAQLMRDENIGFLPVVNDAGEPVGVITDRDLVVRALASGRDEFTFVGDLLDDSPLVTCWIGEDLPTVEERMARTKKSRILVVDDHFQLVGVISLSDIAHVEQNRLRVADLLEEVTRREAVELVRAH